MIGVGTQDSFELATQFVLENGTQSFPMLWDPTFESWLQLGVSGQPAWLLLAPDGSLVEGGYGPIDEEFVLAFATEP